MEKLSTETNDKYATFYISSSKEISPSLTLSIISGYQYTDQRKFRNNFSMIFKHKKYKELIEILNKNA